jgi:hypothetical protein
LADTKDKWKAFVKKVEDIALKSQECSVLFDNYLIMVIQDFSFSKSGLYPQAV